MRNFKRFLALVLAMLMLNGMMVFSAGAAEVGDYNDAAKRLSAVGILKGDGAGNLMLNAPVKRWQTALFFVQVLTGTTDAASLNSSKTSTNFTDVVEYGTAIDQAYGFGIVKGRGNGVYGYNDNIIYQDMLVMAVRALGYETEDMSYPYGHILAAEKLGLTYNLDIVDFKKPLTRGETAQIIWNTLITDIAFVDPISEKIIYPNEPIPTQGLIKDENDEPIEIERENYLKRSKFTQGTLEGVIVDYVEGKSATDIDIATVDIDGTEYEFNALDLGIDDETYKSYFLNLPVTMYIDCDADDFFKDYDTDPESSEASVVFTNLLRTQNVKNIGSEGNIKVVMTEDEIDYVELDGKKYKKDDYTFDIRVFTEDGWVEDEDETMVNNLVWTKADGYEGFNSYGEVDYAVVTDEDDNNTLMLLYMPYEFGRYAERSLVYQPAGTKMNFVTIGTYVPGVSYKNLSNVSTKFVEYTLGEEGVEINVDSTSVSKKAGELSTTVEVYGEEVASEDFVFYYYNELDNVLTIGYNCGGTRTARLTSFSSNKKTLKIGGTDYEFGFDGAYESDLPEFDDYNFETGYLDKLEVGLNNIHYVLAGDRVVYAGQVNNHTDAKHKYLVISDDAEIMAGLLNMDVDDYEAKVAKTLGLYVDKSNNVKMAVLDTKTGEWTLATIAKVDMGDYDRLEDEYAQTEELSEHFEAYLIFDETYTRYDNLVAAAEILTGNGIVLLRGGDSTGYTVAEITEETLDDSGRYYIDYWETSVGLFFSDVKAVTNKIKATQDTSVSTGRKTLNGDSVIVVIDTEGNVGVRKGIQNEKNSIDASGRFYTATNALIVLQLTEEPNDYNGTPITVAEWAEAAHLGDTYYVVTNESSFTVERNDDGTFTLSFENLFDLGNLEVVPFAEVVVDSLDDTTVDTAFAAGAVIYNGNGEIDISELTIAEALRAAINVAIEDDDDKFQSVDMSAVDFVDHESISVTFAADNSLGLEEVVLNAKDAVSYVDIMLSTINISDVDLEKYDINDMAYVFDGDEAPDYLDNVSKVRLSSENTDKGYVYSLAGMNQTLAVSEPTSGKLNNYIIGTAGDALLIAENDGSYFDNAADAAINLAACGRFDESEGVVTLYIVKLLVNAD